MKKEEILEALKRIFIDIPIEAKPIEPPLMSRKEIIELLSKEVKNERIHNRKTNRTIDKNKYRR